MDPQPTPSRMDRLEAVRDVLAGTIPGADEARLAALVKEYRATLAEIDALLKAAPAPKGTPLDELANRRAGRGSDSAGSGRAVKSSD